MMIEPPVNGKIPKWNINSVSLNHRFIYSSTNPVGIPLQNYHKQTIHPNVPSNCSSSQFVHKCENSPVAQNTSQLWGNSSRRNRKGENWQFDPHPKNTRKFFSRDWSLVKCWVIFRTPSKNNLQYPPKRVISDFLIREGTLSSWF